MSADETSAFAPMGEPLSGELSVAAIPILADHFVAGRPVVPLALMLEWAACEAARGDGDARGPHSGPYPGPCEVRDLRVVRPLAVESDRRRWTVRRLEDASGEGGADGALRIQIVSTESGRPAIVHATATISLRANSSRPAIDGVIGDSNVLGECGVVSTASMSRLYRDALFHGPALQLIEQVDRLDEHGARARVRCDALPRDWMAEPVQERWLTNPPAIDAALQLGILWTARMRGMASLPMGLGAWRMFTAAWPAADRVDVSLVVRSISGARMRGDVAFVHADEAIAELRDVDWIMDAGLAATFRAQAAVGGGARR